MLALAGAIALLLSLAGCALLVERHEERWASWLGHPLIYTLALGTFYTGWSYFGTGAAIHALGLTYFTHEIGWSLLFLFGWPLVLMTYRFAHAHGATTLPGFLAVRYGPSRPMSLLVTLVLTFGMLPYIGLQIQAIAAAETTLSTGRVPPLGSEQIGPALLWAFLLALFAVAFGGRQKDPSRRLPGVFASLALASALKLVWLIVTALVVFERFGGRLFALTPADWPAFAPQAWTDGTYLGSLANLVIGAVSILLMPFMFQIAVVEARNDRQITTARWSFALYGWIAEVAILIVLVAGVWLGLRGVSLQGAMLLAPPGAWRVLAFLGGVAAASGMAIITLIALANMWLLDVVLPCFRSRILGAARLLVPLRAGLIAVMASLAALFWAASEREMLFQLGLIAYVAVSQLAPGFFLGLLWPRLSRRAVAWGFGLAWLVWLYTAFLPSLPFCAGWVPRGPFGLAWLRPQALFGLSSLPSTLHAEFWCTLVNLGAIILVMLRTPIDDKAIARTRLRLAGARLPATGRPLIDTLDQGRVQQLLSAFLGPARAHAIIEELNTSLMNNSASRETRLLEARGLLEHQLRGPLGPGAARAAVAELIPTSDEVLTDVMQGYQQLEQLLTLSQEKLADRVRDLSLLNRIAEQLVRVQAPHELLAAVTGLLHDAFGLDVTAAFVCEDHTLRLASHRGDWPSDVVESLRPLLADAKPRVLSAGTPDERQNRLLERLNVRQLAVTPIRLDELRLGLLACGLRERQVYFSSEFLGLLQAIANGLAVALSAAGTRDREAQLRNQVQATLENLSDPVLVSDGAGRVLMVNEALVALFHVPDPESLPGRELADLAGRITMRDRTGRLLAPAEWPSLVAARTRQIQRQESMRLALSDAREYTLDVTSVPVLDAAGAVWQVVTVYQNLTELYQLKAQLESRVEERTHELATERDRLKRAVEDLSRLEELKGAFVNAVSHDLRIPLTGIIGYTEFLEDEIGGRLSSEQHEFVAQIEQAATRMTRLLNELLDFARLESGHFVVETRPVDFAELLETTLATFRPEWERKGLLLERRVPETLPAIEADPERLIQVLSNLLSNAIKFSPEGGRLTIAAALEPAGGLLRVSVRDNGPGIGPEELSHLFERFYQTAAGRKAGGTGLGLSISKTLIEAQGGRIGVESEPGHGACFWFTLPVATQAGPDAASPPD